MKWALIVYFFVAPGIWKSAEELKYDGWYRMFFDSEKICQQYERRFNDTPSMRIKGVCELSIVPDYLK